MRVALLLLALAACGDGVKLPDAATGTDAADRGLVTFRYKKQTSTVNDRVIFQNADSTIALVTRVNADGEASALMAPGGFVSVYDGPPSSSVLYTWTNVQPGDVITLDLTVDEVGEAFPNASVWIDPLEGADSYFMFNRCQSFVDVSAAIAEPFAPFFQPCAPISDLLLVARDPIGRSIGYRFVNDANLQTTGTIDMRGTYSPFDATIEVTGPADTIISVQSQLVGVFYVTGTSAQITKTQVSVPIQMPVAANATAQTSVRTLSGGFKGDDAQPSELTTIVWGPTTKVTTTDLSTPRIRTFASTPTFDLESYELRWTENDDGERGDVVWAQLGLAGLQWKVIGRRTDETALRLPVMPYDSLRPDSETIFLDNFALIAAEGGYDRLRSYLLGHWNPANGNTWPMNEPSGRVNFRSLR